MTGMTNLLVVLNEDPSQPHIDVRNALQELCEGGELANAHVYAWPKHLKEGRSPSEILDDVRKLITGLEIDALLWTHTAGLRIPPGSLTKGLRCVDFPVLGYWDGDVYEAPFKRIPAEVVQLAAAADVVFCQGFGSMTEHLMKHGAARIEYVPAPTDRWRFMRGRAAGKSPEYDVIMIANRMSRRLPWRRMPGAEWRKELISFFGKKLGSRFAVFGDGWSGTCAHGPVPFDRQSAVYHSGRIALGVNNLHAQYYFSNRLPISMSSGIPVLHNYEKGYEEIFDPDCGLSSFTTTSEAWSLARCLLEKSDEELNAIGARALSFSSSRFDITGILRFMMRTVVDVRDRKMRGEESSGGRVVNPWIGAGQ